jgi:diguanylate cyclase (GGDEF)-like protein
VGSALQKIFQGRGDKTGPRIKLNIKLKKVIPVILIALSWIGLYFKFPLTNPYIWFSLVLSTIAIYLFLRFIKKDISCTFEILLVNALLIAGGIQYFRYNWLHLIYLLYLIPITMIFPFKTVLMLSLSIPLLEIRHFVENNPLEEAASNLIIIISVVMVSLFIKVINKKKDEMESQLALLRENIADINRSSDMEAVRDDTAVSQYLSTIVNADEEIKEMLTAIKHTMLVDSVNLFTSQSDTLRLRCSTDDGQKIIPSGEGLTMTCFRERRKIISSNISDKGYEVGYLKRGKISSFIAIPIVDGTFMLGVLTADTSRDSAFSDIDANTMEMFSKQIIRILQRERVYSQIQRSHTGLRMLHEESSKLASSLKIDVLAQRLIESSHRIVPSSIILLIKKGDIFTVLHHTRDLQIEKSPVAITGTLLDMAAKNVEPLYLSDVRNYSLPLTPFRIKEMSSVFILPLIYEKEFLGLIVFLSEKINAFNPHQIELIEVLGTQASISIANARLHAEIERMATTDGLTGLFNHRHFQERLSAEFKRLSRFPEPLSLMLIDIDYFKKVNDTYGHPAGDKILQGVASILKTTLRDIDIPARYGGEEFASILLGTNSSGAENMAERFRNAIMETTFKIDDKDLKVTVSIGISTITGDKDRKESMIERADQALYHAKKNGRNQSILWSNIKG